MTTTEQYNNVVNKLKEMCVNGIQTRQGKKEFIFGVADDDAKVFSIHGYQFNHTHINKFCHLLNRIDCEYWIYPSNTIVGWTMLVVRVF